MRPVRRDAGQVEGSVVEGGGAPDGRGGAPEGSPDALVERLRELRRRSWAFAERLEAIERRLGRAGWRFAGLER